MNAIATVTRRFCLVHGRVHPAGEYDNYVQAPDELRCIEEMWDNIVPLPAEAVTEVSVEPIEEQPRALHPGDLAYLRTLHAPIPCKVLSITPPSFDQPPKAEVRITANRPGMKRGRRLTLFAPNNWLVPRRGHGPVLFVTTDGKTVL